MINPSKLLRRTLLLIVLCVAYVARAQDTNKSIGGKEHEDNILGVKIGMTVSEALQNVFVNAHRQPGQEKPDTMRHEGADKKDIRVLYDSLKIGKLQVLFAQGQWSRRSCSTIRRALSTMN
jgi:hypothetical protein